MREFQAIRELGKRKMGPFIQVGSLCLPLLAALAEVCTLCSPAWTTPGTDEGLEVLEARSDGSRLLVVGVFVTRVSQLSFGFNLWISYAMLCLFPISKCRPSVLGRVINL